MRVHVVTLFPGMFEGWLREGGVARAIERQAIQVEFVDLRPFGLGRHLQVDDYPFGGGAGMVLMPEPIFRAVESIEGAQDGPIILLTPRGRVMTQAVVEELTAHQHLTLVCGHYEGIDERVGVHLATDRISVGDFVLSGGEPAAMAAVDAVARLLPGVLGAASVGEESFATGLLEYPQYTRPASFRGWEVPEVLLSGHHANVAEWRRRQARLQTEAERPDLISPSPC